MTNRERRPFARRLLVSVSNLILIVVVGGMAAAALVRYSPGFDIDENSWNPKLSQSTRDSMRARKQVTGNFAIFYGRYLSAAVRGNLGQSESFRMPVTELLRARAPISAKLMAWGVSGGLFFGAFLAWLSVWPGRRAFEIFSVSASGLLLAIPPAVLALLFFFEEAPLAAAIALALLPRIFGTMRALLDDLYRSPALLAARARGLTGFTLAFRYVIGAAAPQWLAIIGVALVVAFGSLVPIESLCGVPGIGQLAWKAALSRDLPLLAGLALIVTFLVALVQSVEELATL